jgi:hypothetical protein
METAEVKEFRDFGIIGLKDYYLKVLSNCSFLNAFDP